MMPSYSKERTGVMTTKGGDKPHLTKLVSLNGLMMAYATKKLQAEGGGERGKKDG